MASPTDSARVATNIATAATSHAINVGSPVAGTLLIVFVRFTEPPGVVTFAGYTMLASSDADASNDTTQVYFRQADGAEGATDTLTTANSTKLAAVGWEITGHVNPLIQAPAISTVATGTTTANTCNPNGITPVSVSQDFLFLALGGCDGETAFTAAPTNYVNFQAANTGITGATAVNCVMGGGSRQLTATGDDPGVFTHGAAANGWMAFTVVIFPTGYVRPFPKVPQTEFNTNVMRAATR